jgi:hypothetical protein
MVDDWLSPVFVWNHPIGPLEITAVFDEEGHDSYHIPFFGVMEDADALVLLLFFVEDEVLHGILGGDVLTGGSFPF